MAGLSMNVYVLIRLVGLRWETRLCIFARYNGFELIRHTKNALREDVSGW